MLFKTSEIGILPRSSAVLMVPTSVTSNSGRRRLRHSALFSPSVADKL